MNTKPIDAAFISLRGCHPAIRAVGYAMLAIFLSVLPVSADTVNFQQGVAGYTGAVDTFLQSDPANASTDNSASDAIGWDDDDPNGTGRDVLSLIRFDGIFGLGAGQIPASARIITSATLYLTVFDVGDTGEVREALVPWLDTNTFSSLCGTSCDQGVDFGPPVSTAPAVAATEIGINVTTSLQAWLDGTTNNGWFITPEEGGNGGVDVRSSEYVTLAQRPRLEVVYDEGPPISGNLIREPYLTLATPTSQTICWRSDVVSAGRVQYGTSPGSLTNNADDATVSADHCVNITGLTASTQYWYNVGSTTAVEGGGSADHYFWTHPTVGSNAPFTFWAVGDGGNGTPDQVTVMEAMVTENGGVSPDLAIYLGDIAYNSGTDAEFTNNYFAPYAPVIRNMVVWPTLGNHEGASTTSGDPGPSFGPYYNSFVMPANAEAGGLASGTEAYYSFDYGNVHFISLNSYEVSRAPGGPMDTWLFNDLAATTQQWVVAYWHHPPYSKGTHNSDTEGELIQMRENLLPTLEAGGVDLVLCGHSHTYERSYLIDGTYSTPTPAFATLEASGNIIDDGDGRPTGDGAYLKSPGPNAHEGTVYVVAGHGGQPVAGSQNHPVMFFGENVKGSVLVDVEENSLTVRNVRITGVVSDDFMIQKGDLPPRVTGTVPAGEAVLGALPSIEVSFTVAVTGVDANDLTVNGSVATNVTGSGAGPYVFTGYVGPGDGLVNVNLAAGGIVDASDPALLFTGDSWSYTIDTSPPAIASETPQRGTSNGVLPSVTVNFTKPVFNVSADDLLVNSSPATTLVGIDGTSGPYIFTGYAEPDQGLVTVELLQDGIQDDQALLFPGDTWNYLLETRLVINEFLASNNTIIADEGGGFDDYLEIHNPGNSPVSMGGMYLTNELDDPTRYEIPAGVSIPAGGYLLFWCDGNSAAGPLHTNFNLDKDAITNEDIGLFDTEANGFAIIDGLTYTLQTSDISSGRFPDATNGIVTMPPTPEATNTINCSVPADCSALNGTCTVGDCAGGLCVAVATNEGGTCEDGISCTSGETCSAGDCTGGTSDCPAGQICNVLIDLCEAFSGPNVGDVIISGFQASTNATEWFELFNTTDQPISLSNMNIVTSFDLPLAAPDGSLDVDWDMTADNPGLDLTGLTIAPYSFFQVQEGAGGDLSVPTVDLSTGEMGIGELTLSIELTVGGVHMDYVLYGNNGQTAAPPIAPGDVAWNGTSFPRDEVIRSVTDTAAFNEGSTWRATAADLHAGYDALGFYSDDAELGVWSSDHSTTQTTGPRNSSSTAVPPPAQVCTSDAECDDLAFCNGVETCDIPSGLCVAGTAPDCSDAISCTDDICNETLDVCENPTNDGNCDNGVFCDGAETCDAVSDCQNGTPVDCGTQLCSNPLGQCVDCLTDLDCTGDDVCNLTTGICGPPNQLPIVIGDVFNYFKGTEEPSPGGGGEATTDWTEIVFDDSTWLNGATGFAYGPGLHEASDPDTNTVISDMSGNYVSLYFRRDFHVDNPLTVDSMTLTVDYDDAFIAYVNGVEVLRTAMLVGLGDPPAFDQLGNAGTNNHEGDTTEIFDLAAAIPQLVAGTNVLSIQLHNSSLLSTDMVLRPIVTATFDATPCLVDADCDDDAFCNGTETCDVPSGACQPGTPPNCADTVACTIDSCNETTDSCEIVPDDGACDDSNVCTDDTCNILAGCLYDDNTAPCEDGDLCTGPDQCSAGACTTAGAIDCDDLIDCTDDSCDSGSGCANVDNCPGGTFCNLVLDICDAGPAAPDLPIDVGDDWRYFRGTVEPTPGADLRAWTEMLFDDSGWEGPAPSGFGYGADCAALHGTVLDGTNPPAMSGNYVSVYARKLFNIDNPVAVTDLELVMDYDDGWVAYINGVEVARSAGMGGTPGVPPTFDQTTATGDHECSLAGVPNAPDVIDLSAAIPLLNTGTNVLAIQGHNRSSTSSDFSLIPSMSATIDAGCTVDADCDDFNSCTDDTCNTGTGECIFTNNDTNLCDDANACTDDVCSAGLCVGTPNDANLCTDDVDCTDDACATGVCLSVDNCTGGDVCNEITGICETPSILQAGDVIISGFQPSNPAGTDEWIELFNTTTSAIALDNLQLITSIDANGDGTATVDWQFGAGLLNGASIPAQGFFLLRELATAPAGDYTGALDLATGEGGTRAISLQLLIDGAHMDYVLYGREDLEPGATADVPPGDLPFDGSSFPRAEVVRNCGGSGAGAACTPGTSYTEGAIMRLSDVDLYAGHDVDGRYKDEATLGDGYAVGVWNSDHAVPPLTDPRNTGSPTVPPPSGTPCTTDTECDDNDVCNGIETCNLGISLCEAGTPLVCDDGNVCTDDSCDAVAGCQTTDNTDPCDDLNACTSGDVCGAGVCAGAPIVCDDGASCTDDSCDSLLGCQFIDNCPFGQNCNVAGDVCESGPAIVMFQEGVGGYTGTQDSVLRASDADATHGTLGDTCPGNATFPNIPCDNFEWDGEDGGAGLENTGLIRFGGITGPGAGQIPAGATIVSATLELTVWDASVAPPADLYISLAGWDEGTVTFNNFGGDAGVQPDELGADVGDAPIALGTQTSDVTAAVQAWVDNPAGNFGLIIVPSATTDGAIVRSSEYATVAERPKLTVEYVDAGVTPQMTCALSSPTVGPGGSVDLEVFLSSPDGDVDMNAFQTQILITQTSGTGSMDVPCPGGVLVDDGRPDYVFFNEANEFSATTCSLQRASGNLLVGSKTVGVTPVYLSEYTLEVALGTTAGSTFEVSFITSPGSRLFNGSSEEMPLSFGPVCTLTVQGCGLDSDCNDGDLCTTDVCNAGTCENTILDCSGLDDECNLGVCNSGTGSCEQQPANEGLTCDDLDACTMGDTCASGVCVAGPPMDCNDANLCTNEACVAGTCVYSPSGICSIEGDISYYRDFNNDNGFEPSTKGVPNVDIDINQDALVDATSTSGGGFLVLPADLTVVVEPLEKLGATTISDHNNAISGTDASIIGSFSVGLGDPSDLQLVAADVSGDGEPSAFDAARVAQFSVGLLPTAHFQVALDNQSDWAFFRCDNYVDQTNQDCGPPSYTHDPLTAPEVDDNFYALLYGDVTGNWEPAGGPAPPQGGESSQSLPETAAGLGAQEFRVDLGDADTASRLALLRQMPGGELRPDIFFELVPTAAEVVNGVRRQTYLLVMQHADGLQGLDLEIEYNSSQVEIVDVRKGDAAAGFGLLSNGLQGAHKIGLFGVLPLQGTGTLLELTVETGLRVDGTEPFQITARANEKPVPVRLQGDKRELGSARP